MADKSQVPGDILNTYCWISSTFTLPKHYTCEPGETCLSGGVGPEEEEDERVYHAYYQWVPFFLFFQVTMGKKYLRYFMTVAKIEGYHVLFSSLVLEAIGGRKI